eukprot:scaffold25305_cov99-Isochrysis_galbana.AAC.4
MWYGAGCRMPPVCTYIIYIYARYCELFVMGRLAEWHVRASRGTGCFFWRHWDWATECLADC